MHLQESMRLLVLALGGKEASDPANHVSMDRSGRGSLARLGGWPGVSWRRLEGAEGSITRSKNRMA